MHGTDAGRSKVREPGVTRGNSRYGSREVRDGRNRRYVRNGLGLGIRAVALPPTPTPGLDGLK